MKIEQARAIASLHSTPVAAQVDPFAGLSEELTTELRDILTPAVVNRLQMERDPVMPAAVGIGLAGGIYRVAVVTSPTTGVERAAILNPAMQAITKDEFHNLIRALHDDPTPAEPAPIFVFDREPPPKSFAQRQLDALHEIRDLLAEIRNRLP